MKRIVLAKKSSRVFAGLIDFVLLIGSTLSLFLPVVFPLTFNKDAFISDKQAITNYISDSGLFLVSDDGAFSGKSTFDSYSNLSSLYDTEITYKGKKYSNINVSKDLFTFYTEKYIAFEGNSNITIDGYKTNILKINTSTSNILDFNETDCTFTLIDSAKYKLTISYFLSIFKTASEFVISNQKVKSLQNHSTQIIVSAILWIIPVFIAFSLIYNLLIPILSKNGQTIGKYIFRLAILSKEGYHLKKIKYIPRWFIYSVVEILLGFMTFGGVFLITYTMFMFMKKHQCLHDVIAGSIVIDNYESIYFSNPTEERFYEEKAALFK